MNAITTAMPNRQALQALADRIATGYRIAPNTPLLPIPALNQAVAELEAATQPCDRETAVRWVRWLIDAYRANDRAFRDQSHAAVFQRFLAHNATAYPADILEAAVHELVRTSRWLPVTAELVQTCERLMQPRRAELQAARAMLAEHERRAADAGADKRTGFQSLTPEQQTEHQARMAALFARWEDPSKVDAAQ